MPAHQSSTFTGEGGLTLTRFIVEAQNGALTRCPEKPYDPENPTDAGYCGAC